MINPLKSIVIDYDGGRQATVYGDKDDPNTYYLMPEARVVEIDGAPQFSIVSYKKNDGEVAGRCTFQIEMHLSDSARAAAEAKLGPNVNWGQFVWVAVNPFFWYSNSEGSQLITSTASMYGSNRSTFILDFNSDADVKAFAGSLEPKEGGGLSPFSIEFQSVVLADFPSVNVLVKYDAQIAIDYEAKYETKKDMWGSSKQILIGVKQNLKTSGAGDVKIDWKGPEPDPETRGRVYDWAFVTLEGLVEDALEYALQLSGGKNPVSYTSDIIRTYSENQIVEWPIKTARVLPRFTLDEWSKVYSEVDTRQLSVDFALRGELTKDDGGIIVQQVDITVDYPTLSKTFTLRPQDNASYTFVAPGSLKDGQFDPSYKYKYAVIYQSGAPYQSDWITSEDTSVVVLPNELGIRKVQFVGSLIPFAGSKEAKAGDKTVDSLSIDFFFQRPGGQPNLVQSAVMKANGVTGAVSFESLFNLPLTNTYTYRLTYQMTDGTTYIAAPTDALGLPNKALVTVLNPLLEQTFALRCLVPKPTGDNPHIINAYLTVRYRDDGFQSIPKHVFNWDPPTYEGSGTPKYVPASATRWDFAGTDNPEGAYYEIDGDVVYDEGQFAVNGLCIQAKTGTLLLDPRTEAYSVTVESSNVNWDLVSAVQVTLLTGTIEPESEDLKAWIISPRSKTAPMDLKVDSSLSYPLLSSKDPHQQQTKRYFTVTRPRDSDSIVFYYTAVYINKDGTTKTIKEQEVKNQFVLVLPSQGEVDGFNLVRREIVLTKVGAKSESYMA
jgi:hypothetical protein